MNSSPRWLFLRLAATLLVVFSGTLRAAPALEDFNHGTAAFNEGNLAQAAEAFRAVIEKQSPLAPVATLFLAKCSRREKHWGEAQALLDSLDRNDENLTAGIDDERHRLVRALSDEATELLRQGDAESALGLFQQALRNESNEQALYGRALALARLHRADEEQQALAEYLRQFPDGSYVSDAQVFREQFAPPRIQPWWLQLETGAGYDSNVFLTAAGDTPVSAPALRLTIDGGTRLSGSGPGMFARLGYRGSWTEHLGQESGRFTANGLRAYVGYQDAHWFLQASPSVTYQTVGTDPYLLQTTVAVDVQHSWESVGIGAQYEVGRNFAQSTSYNYIEGYGHWGDVHLDATLGAVRLRALYVVGFEGIADLVSGTTLLPLRDFAQGPGVKIYFSQARWATTLSATYLFRRYLTLAQPGNLERNDQQLLSSLRVARVLSPQLSLFGSFGVVWNQSTLGATSGVSDRNYTQLFTLMGVTWNVLE